ncbi:MAG TPA: hypothetical protein VFV25_11220 [Methylibium sp.]
MRIKLTLTAAAALLAGCGGGSDEALQPPQAAGDMVPSSATASVAAYVQYVGSLPASEAAEPLRLDSVVAAPISDNAEPFAI